MQIVKNHVSEEQLASTFFPVEKVRNPESRHGYSIIRSDTGERLSDVSEKYRLVSNEEAVKPFLDRYGIESLVSIGGAGGAYNYKFDLGEEIDLGGGDLLRRQGYVTNSYNKTIRFNWQDGVLRAACSNGLFVFQSGLSISDVHYGDFDFERVKEAILSSGNTDLNLDVWRSLKEVQVTEAEKLELIRQFDALAIKPPKDEDERRRRVLYGYAPETTNRRIRHFSQVNAQKRGYDLENPQNGWGLLNNLNWGIDKACGASWKRKGSLQRIISLNKKAEEFCVSHLLN